MKLTGVVLISGKNNKGKGKERTYPRHGSVHPGSIGAETLRRPRLCIFTRARENGAGLALIRRQPDRQEWGLRHSTPRRYTVS